jgi:hypothetical protein
MAADTESEISATLAWNKIAGQAVWLCNIDENHNINETKVVLQKCEALVVVNFVA